MMKVFSGIFLLLILSVTVASAGANNQDASASKSNNESNQKMLEDQFKASLDEVLPLSPAQIGQLKNKMRSTEKAIRNRPAPQIASRTVRVSLTAGAKIPVIEMMPGYVTPVVVYDITGQPWPITSKTNGNKKFFTVTRPEVPPLNHLNVSCLTEYANTNVVMTLEGHDYPVNIQIKTVDVQKKERKTAGQIALQVDQRGPNAVMPSIEDSTGSSVSDVMLSFIDGVPPGEAERFNLEPENNGIKAWKYKESFYIRSRHPLVWPAWEEVDSGAGGQYKVYKIPSVPSLMVSVGGATRTLSLQPTEAL